MGGGGPVTGLGAPVEMLGHGPAVGVVHIAAVLEFAPDLLDHEAHGPDRGQLGGVGLVQDHPVPVEHELGGYDHRTGRSCPAATR